MVSKRHIGSPNELRHSARFPAHVATWFNNVNVTGQACQNLTDVLFHVNVKRTLTDTRSLNFRVLTRPAHLKEVEDELAKRRK